LSATGGTGRLIVRDAVAKGHSVVILVRSKARALPQSISATEPPAPALDVGLTEIITRGDSARRLR
jgi:uncharacterized protein YbjT (DUF2867 family)